MSLGEEKGYGRTESPVESPSLRKRTWVTASICPEVFCSSLRAPHLDKGTRVFLVSCKVACSLCRDQEWPRAAEFALHDSYVPSPLSSSHWFVLYIFYISISLYSISLYSLGLCICEPASFMLYSLVCRNFQIPYVISCRIYLYLLSLLN